jgi:dsDNA-specific endonuclease/ATPase MutS2
VEEAWESVDKLLDRALPVGLTKITLIHGMGPGRLREVLLERLASDPRVARTEVGGSGERRNPGATVVILRP